MQDKRNGRTSGESDDRLELLGTRLSSLRKVRQEPKSAGGAGTHLGLAFRLITELVAGVVVGVAIGWFLDGWLGTSPLFLLVFFCLGVAAGVMNVMRTATAMDEATARDEAAKGPSAES